MNIEIASPRPRVSILVPCFNEEATVERCYRTIVAVFAGLPEYDYEILFSDNRSTDATFAILRGIALADPRVRVIRLSRNFGYQRSLLLGYKTVMGDCAIQLDCDLQDPPELIPQMLARWREGYRVVYGVRRSLRDRAVTGFMRRGFYRLITRLSDDPLPIDAGEFRLVDARILQELRAVDDTSPYLRGLISAMGFAQIGIPYDRQERIAGDSKFPLKAMLALGMDGLLNHSLLPLRLASMVGLVVGSVTLLMIFGYMIARLAFGAQWPAGFATTTVLLLSSIALNAMFFGIVGEYLGRIFMQAKKQPRALIDTFLNPPASDAAPGAPAIEPQVAIERIDAAA